MATKIKKRFTTYWIGDAGSTEKVVIKRKTRNLKDKKQIKK